MRNKEIRPKTHCNLCHQEIFDNINPEKIITCAHCVLILLSLSEEKKIEYKNSLLSKGLDEQVRSVESFIPEETNDEIATFKKILHLRHSTPHIHRVQHGFRYVYRRT